MSSDPSERAPREEAVRYHLILFVAGDEPNSRLARANIDRLCGGEELLGRCTLDIVNVLEDFDAAAEYDILVTPTLLVVEPSPGAVVIGNLSDLDKVRSALARSGE